MHIVMRFIKLSYKKLTQNIKWGHLLAASKNIKKLLKF